MDKDFGSQPFRLLGLRLRSLRQKIDESLGEVSGAVEIEVAQLERIEAGEQRPTEDVLMLLINHFEMGDDDAVSLWELAGYQNPEQSSEVPLENMLTKQPVLMLMAVDSRIVYTDGITISATREGVVLNFTQSGSQTASGQPLTVARLGMSPAQAANVAQALNQSLSMLGRPISKTLPPGSPYKNHPHKKSDAQ